MIAEPQPQTVGPISRTDIVRYQGASGDFNPIHHDDGFAATSGYPSAFAPGMLQAGLVSAYAIRWLGADNIRRFATRFRGQVWPGDRLVITGRVDSVDRRGDADVVCTSYECRTGAADEVVLTAEATFLIPIGDARTGALPIPLDEE